MAEVSPPLKKSNHGVNILSLSVIRRDGLITPFKSDKIFNAIKKAFLAQTKIRNNKDKDKEQKENIHKTVEDLTTKVISATEKEFKISLSTPTKFYKLELPETNIVFLLFLIISKLDFLLIVT